MEELCLLLGVDLSLDPLGEDLSLDLPLASASVPEAVLVVVLPCVVAAAVLDFTPVAGQGTRGGSTCCL